MTKHILAAAAAGAAILAPASLSAQAERSSPVPTYHLLQLSVETEAVEAEDFASKTAAIRSCGEATDLAKELDAKVTRNRFVRATQLPDSLQDVLREVETGHATPIFSADPSVMRVLVICNRAQA